VSLIRVFTLPVANDDCCCFPLLLLSSAAAVFVCYVQRDAAAMEVHLAAITSSLQAMQALLSRMGERCDPYVYYKRVRVPMSGEAAAAEAAAAVAAR
jgi:hypothetical protein